MANEKRLIDANAIIGNLQEALDRNDDKRDYHTYRAFNVVLNKLKNTPTVDAVEVVRCKDCKHFDEHTGKCYLFCDSEYIVELEVDSDHFCSYGERKDNG